MNLDTILSSAFYFSAKWSPDLGSNKARDMLRYLLYRLYDQSRGNLFAAEISLSQGFIGQKIGCSRQWAFELLHRLERAGWLRVHSVQLPDGTRTSCRISAGRQLKRLLIMLKKSTVKKPVKPSWKFSPLTEMKRLFKPTPDKEVGEEVFRRIPLLDIWRKRGG